MRARAFTRVGDVLRGLLAYVLCATPFRQVGAWSVLIGLANLSHVAWQKQLRKARSFLPWLLGELRAVPIAATAAQAHSRSSVQRIVLIDATRLKEPGGSGGALDQCARCIWSGNTVHNGNAGVCQFVRQVV